MLVEDVGTSDEVLVGGPDSVDCTGVSCGVVFGNALLVAGGEGDDFGDVELAKEFDAGGADEGETEFGFGLSPGFTDE